VSVGSFPYGLYSIWILLVKKVFRHCAHREETANTYVYCT